MGLIKLNLTAFTYLLGFCFKREGRKGREALVIKHKINSYFAILATFAVKRIWEGQFQITRSPETLVRG